MYDTLVNKVLFLAQERPDKLAVAFKKDRLTYGNLVEKMKLTAAKLRYLGLQKGERVLFSAVSKPEAVVAYLAIQYYGAVAVPVDKNILPENVFFLYEDTEAVLFLTDRPMKEYEQKCRRYSLRKICDMDASELTEIETGYRMPVETEIAEILFTTGTTGKPKGVMLSYKAVYHILKNTIDGIGITEQERLLLPLPLNHSFAMRELRAVLYMGATVILQNGFVFSKEIENNLDTYQCTALAVVPASIETIAGQMQDRFVDIMKKFRYIEAGAGSLSVNQRKRLVSSLPDTVIYNTWGSSESGGVLFLNVTENVSDPVKVQAVGKPLPCVRLMVLNEDGKQVAGDRANPGRMALRGDMQMSGYWNSEVLTKQTLRDGWLLTSDMVYTDEEGYVYMLGRADDIINVGGEKVSPMEVENIAGEYSDIRECACVGVEDPNAILGMVPVLYVVPGSSHYTDEGLRLFLAERLERYKLPTHYISLPELPRNRMQKIDRKALRILWDTGMSENLMNPVIRNIFTRRSVRKFEDKPIPRLLLDMILKAGYYAPSGHNMQTWRFTVVEDKNKIARLKEATLLAAKEQGVYCYGFENPACVILISNDERNHDGCQDASCAAENIFLAAHSYGIGSVWLNALMTLRKKEPVKSILDEFGIPKNHIVWCMAALGYPVAEGVMLEKRKNVVFYV